MNQKKILKNFCNFEISNQSKFDFMSKILYIIGLSTLMVSCAAQNTPAKSSASTAQPPKQAVTQNPNPVPVGSQQTGLVTFQGVEFYKQNIGDISKNDNTISHGSIVTASPQGFRVVKRYFPAVGQNFRQKYLILHYTALDEDRSVRVLTEQSVSAHYLVNNLGDNEIYQLVDENKRAYHAGISAWRKDINLNDTSIGIEIVNTGYVNDSIGKKVFAPFDAKQMQKVAALVKDIADRYQIPPTNILAHSDVAPTRKQDPGPLFPWKKLYDEYQIGMWYNDADKQRYLAQLNPELFMTERNSSTFIYTVQRALKEFGYDINPTGAWTKENTKVVEAFQYHFRPENYDGIIDAETWAILQALIQKYPQK